MPPSTIRGDVIPEHCKIIEIQLQNLDKLFDAMDPAPFDHKALNPNVVEHVVGNAREFSYRAQLALIVHVAQPSAHPLTDQQVCNAMRAHFADLSTQQRRKLRLHLRRGVISLIIGLSVLASALVGSKLLGEGTIASTIRETLDIGGWVALWRPMEIFLYDWWPILGDLRLYRRLGQMPIQIR